MPYFKIKGLIDESLKQCNVISPLFSLNVGCAGLAPAPTDITSQGNDGDNPPHSG